MKPYLKEMNLSDARMYYRIKYHLVPTIRLNQKNNKRYKAQKWLCPDCSISKSLSDHGNYANYDYDDDNIAGYHDDQQHVKLSCIANQTLRSQTNFDKPKEVVNFFQAVVVRRKKQNRD